MILISRSWYKRRFTWFPCFSSPRFFLWCDITLRFWVLWRVYTTIYLPLGARNHPTIWHVICKMCRQMMRIIKHSWWRNTAMTCKEFLVCSWWNSSLVQRDLITEGNLHDTRFQDSLAVRKHGYDILNIVNVDGRNKEMVDISRQWN